QGGEKGDRVVLCTTDKLAFLIAHLGSLLAGAVSLPLNPRFRRDELRFFLADSAAKVVVGGAEERRILEALRPELPQLRAVIPDLALLDSSSAPFREPALFGGGAW